MTTTTALTKWIVNQQLHCYTESGTEDEWLIQPNIKCPPVGGFLGVSRPIFTTFWCDVNTHTHARMHAHSDNNNYHYHYINNVWYVISNICCCINKYNTVSVCQSCTVPRLSRRKPNLTICLCVVCRSGKSSIQKVVFHKMSPNETLFLESTTKIIKDGEDGSGGHFNFNITSQ